MSSPSPIIVRWGDPTVQAVPESTETLVWADLDPPKRPDDWLVLLRRLAALESRNQPIVVLKQGVEIGGSAMAALLRAVCLDQRPRIVAALNNLEPGMSPLPPGTILPAPLPVDAVDRTCAWLGRNLAVERGKPGLAAAAWHPASARILLQSGWSGDQPLPADVTSLTLDSVFAGDPDRPLAGPEPWPLNEVPPPTDPFEPMRSRWPVDYATKEPQLYDFSDTPIPTRDQRPVVLHVCHAWGGGSHRFIHDLAEADSERCHLLLSARGATPRQQFGEWLELSPAALPELVLARYPLSPPIADTATEHTVYKQVIDDVMTQWRVDGVIVSSLIGHSLAALTTGKPTLVVCHDYYPLWPELDCDFGDRQRRFDRDELMHDLAERPLTLFAARDADHWWRLRGSTIQTLCETQPVMVAPSAQVRDNWQRLAPELADLDWRVVPHGNRPWPSGGPLPAEANSAAGQSLRILVPGRINGGKALNLLRPLLDRLDARFEWLLLGTGASGAELHGHPRVHILGNYQRDELPALLASLKPDLALLPATIAETFGYLLSELQSLCLPVLATTTGSYPERIRDGLDGLLVTPDADAIARRLLELLTDPSPLSTIRSHLANTPIKDTRSMAADYRSLLPLPMPASLPAPVAPSWRDLQHAWLARRALEIDRHRDRLHAALEASEAELARRADWGFDLSRQLEQRTHWAQSLEADVLNIRATLAERDAWIASLQAEMTANDASLKQVISERDAWIGQLKSDLETIYRSRSWRLMGPARRLARALRALKTRLAFRWRRFINLGHRGRLSLATRGLVGTVQHLRQRRNSAVPPPREPVPIPSKAIPPSALPTSEEPLVTLVIPVYGKLPYTCACLTSLADHADAIPFEVIVVDDCSPDDTAPVLSKVEGLRLIRNDRNLGFVGSCNAGAAAARGRWLVFLNNDTQVTPGWLKALLDTHADFENTGLVGAKLVYPDGRLQEAGGLVFSDGSGWNYGRFGNPDDPRYNYARPTHYCSGAAILIERDLFEELGAFDTRYAPAYYEDTDLAFKVRASGRQVIYQPAATVIHFEGITSGTDTGAGVKRHQVINQETFRQRWQSQMRQLPKPGTSVDMIARGSGKPCVLVIDATVPEPDQDSGSVRLLNILRLLRDSGRHVIFFPDNRAYVPGYTERLQKLGVETLFHPWLEHPVNWLREHGPELEAVLVSRHYIAANYLEPVRQYAPKAKFIFDTVDLHYLREERAAALTGSEEIRRESSRTRAQEHRLIRAADVTLVVSPAERALLNSELPGCRVEVLSNVHPVPGRRREFAERRGLMFVGGFQHPPNVDAVLWLCNEVFPHVRAALPDIVLHIIGSKMPPSIADLAIDGVVIEGFVAELEPFLDDCRIALAPLRYGAGVKGKINMSMSYGQPVVATGVGVEGMYLTPGQDVLVADEPEAFAAEIVRLYGDETLWRRLSDAGIDNVRRHFSFEAARQALDRILAG